MMLYPRHRGDCADFFATPKQSERIDIRIPTDLQSELEHEAARAGHTWNDHMGYIVRILIGHQQPGFDDERSVGDWRTLMSPCMFQLTEGGEWFPFTCLGASRHEHEAISQASQHAQ